VGANVVAVLVTPAPIVEDERVPVTT